MRKTLLTTIAILFALPAMAGETTCRFTPDGWKICDHHLKPGELGPLSTHTPPPDQRPTSRYVEDDADDRQETTGPMYFPNRSGGQGGCIWNYGNSIYGKC